MIKDNYVTVTDYAKHKKISRQATDYRIKHGLIKAERVGAIWLIERSELDKQPSN